MKISTATMAAVAIVSVYDATAAKLRGFVPRTSATPSFGAYTSDNDANGVAKLNDLAATLNRVIVVAPWTISPVGGSTTVNPAFLTAVKASGRTPLLRLMPWDPAAGANQATYSLSNIARGDFDSFFASIADGLKGYGSSVYVCLMPEMNGNWYPWGNGQNANSTTNFINAWRHVVGVFRGRGATNVKFVWAPYVKNYLSGSRSSVPFLNFYPGNSYVDVLGVSGYNYGATTGASYSSFSALFSTSYTDLTRISSAKPIWITKTGTASDSEPTRTSPDPLTKAAWITDMWKTLPAKFPRVSTVVWDNVAGDRDWRADENAASIAAFGGVVTPAPAPGPTPPPTPPPAGITPWFDPAGPLNTPLGSSRTVDPNSAAMMIPLVDSVTRRQFVISSKHWSVPVYHANASTPKYDVAITSMAYATRIHQVPIPDDALPDPEADGHLGIIDDSTGCFFEFLGAVKSAGGGSGLLPNGDFETGVQGYISPFGTPASTITQDSVNATSGSKSMKVVTQGADLFEGVQGDEHDANGFAVVAPNTTYTAQVKIKGAAGTVQFRIQETTNTGAFVKNDTTASFVLDGTTQTKTLTITTQPTTGRLTIGVFTSVQAAITFWLDSGKIEAGSTATPFTTSTSWTASFAQRGTLATHSGIQPGGQSARASGFVNMAGLVRPEEVQAGVINHALAIGYPYTKAGGPVAPATKSDGRAATENGTATGNPAMPSGGMAIPEGARLDIDPSFDLNSLSLQPWERTLAVALQTYGGYVVDTSGSTTIYAQNPQSYTTGNPFAPYWGDGDYAYLTPALASHMRVMTMPAQQASPPSFLSSSTCAVMD
jgi:hypothetical protein